MKPRDRILLLLSVHLAIGLVAAFYGPNLLKQGGLPQVWNTTLVVAFVGLWAAQATLIGFVGGLAPASVRMRLAAMLAGCAYLWFLSMAAGGAWSNGEEALMFAWWAVIPSTAIAGVLSWVRRRRACLEAPLSGSDFVREPIEGLRFATRHLFLLTAIIAALFAGGRFAQILGSESSLIVMLAIITPMFAACGIAVGAAALWAGLGLRAPLARTAVVLALAAALGVIPASYFGAVWWRWLVWPGVLTAQTAIVIASLWVVRLSAGAAAAAERARTH